MNVRIRLLSVVVYVLVLMSFSPAWAQWSAPEPVSEINSSYIDKSPFLSSDGLTLYFSRQSGPGWYYSRIYKATRSVASGPFEAVSEISSLNYNGGHVDSPWVSPDNLRMYFFRTEPGSLSRIKMSTRSSVTAAWPDGANLDELNALGRLASPTLTSDELVIVFSGSSLAGGVGGHDLWMATRVNRTSSFGTAINLTELNTVAADYHPSLTGDGLSLYFISNRNGSFQVFVAERSAVGQPFGSPVPLTELEVSDAVLDYPFVTQDRGTLYFTRDYGQGRDIYMSTSLVDPNVDPNSVVGDYYVNAATGSDFNNGRTRTSPFATIQRGLTAAQNGQVVVVAEGTYVGTGNKNLSFGGRAVTLISSAGAEATIIDCQGSGQAFTFQSGDTQNTVVNGFTMTHGNAQTGGAIYCQAGSPRIVNCVISNNQGYYSGGVYSISYGSPTFVNCQILGNTGTLGGGVRFAQSGGALVNCIIAGNVSQDPGAGIKCDNGNTSPVIANCTVTGNISASYGGGLWATYASPLVKNSIFWGNQGTAGAQIAVGVGGAATVSYSDIQGGQAGLFTSGGFVTWGVGNLDQDPLFVDAQAGDYHLQSFRGRYWAAMDLWILDHQTSPCIDAGDGLDDVLDEPNPNGGIINMGAYGGTPQASLSEASDSGVLPGDVNEDGVIDFSDLFSLIDLWLIDYGSVL
jgi:Tol biopolymer transport system component